MDHYQDVYASKAQAYHRMIAVEDVDENLLRSLTQITDWNGKTVLDLGSGTGRFPLLFRGFDCRFTCLDLYAAMLQENRKQREAVGGSWSLVQGDMRRLPFPRQRYDVVIAGWAIGHLRSWFEADWQRQIGIILSEMQRMVRPGGVVIICETMSTGSLVPQPPVRELAEYYDWLENAHRFSAEVIQTDYLFDSVEEAAACTEFFFGQELAAKIRENQWARLPEWTGIWFRHS